ncbi:MAG: hypothetical protein ACRDD8_13285 [Bacteroidales bacterium]
MDKENEIKTLKGYIESGYKFGIESKLIVINHTTTSETGKHVNIPTSETTKITAVYKDIETAIEETLKYPKINKHNILYKEENPVIINLQNRLKALEK